MSARPGSARRRNTLDLRTIPENSPFIRPLSGAAKLKQKQHQQSSTETIPGGRGGILRGSGGEVMIKASSGDDGKASNHGSLGSRLHSGAAGAHSSPSSSDGFRRPQTTGELRETHRGGAANLGGTLGQPSPNPTSSPIVHPTGTSSDFGLDADEMVAPTHIVAVCGTCVDPARPPLGAFVNFPQAGALPAHSRSPAAKHGAVAHMDDLEATSLSAALEALRDRARCTGHHACWVTTGSFPQALHVRLRRTAVLRRMQVIATGNPRITLRANSMEQPRAVLMGPMAAGSGAFHKGGNAKRESSEGRVRLHFSVADGREVAGRAGVLYALEFEGTPLAATGVRGLNICLETADESFCAVSCMRIWGALKK